MNTQLSLIETVVEKMSPIKLVERAIALGIKSESIEPRTIEKLRQVLTTVMSEYRMKLYELMEPHAVKRLLDGKNATSLFDSMELCLTPSGVLVAAGTDMGVGYKDHNEDRVVVNADKDFFAVIDGVGGSKDGEKAAHILAKYLLKDSTDAQKAGENAQESMRHSRYDGSACFISARIQTNADEQRLLEISQVGDCALMVIEPDGQTLSFVSEDESMVQGLVKEGILTEEQAMHNRFRDIVTNDIGSKKEKVSIKTYPPHVLTPGARILLASDGLFSNLTPAEVAQEIAGISAQEAFYVLSEKTTQRMEYKKVMRKMREDEYNHLFAERMNTGVYPDGYRLPPKGDNRSLVIIDVPR